MDSFTWLFGGLTVVFTVFPAILYLNDEQEEAIRLLVGFWGGVLTVVAFTIAMMFVVKPILNWGFNLVF